MSGGTAQDDYRAAISAQRYQADAQPEQDASADWRAQCGQVRPEHDQRYCRKGCAGWRGDAPSPARELPDWGPLYAAAIEDIAVEAKSARRKFPPFNSAHEGWAVMFEELDECWDEVRADNHDRAIAEAIQVGAMAVRFIADMRAKGYGS